MLSAPPLGTSTLEPRSRARPPVDAGAAAAVGGGWCPAWGRRSSGVRPARCPGSPPSGSPRRATRCRLGQRRHRRRLGDRRLIAALQPGGDVPAVRRRRRPRDPRGRRPHPPRPARLRARPGRAGGRRRVVASHRGGKGHGRGFLKAAKPLGKYTPVTAGVSRAGDGSGCRRRRRGVAVRVMGERGADGQIAAGCRYSPRGTVTDPEARL